MNDVWRIATTLAVVEIIARRTTAATAIWVKRSTSALSVVADAGAILQMFSPGALASTVPLVDPTASSARDIVGAGASPVYHLVWSIADALITSGWLKSIGANAITISIDLPVGALKVSVALAATGGRIQRPIGRTGAGTSCLIDLSVALGAGIIWWATTISIVIDLRIVTTAHSVDLLKVARATTLTVATVSHPSVWTGCARAGAGGALGDKGSRTATINNIPVIVSFDGHRGVYADTRTSVDDVDEGIGRTRRTRAIGVIWRAPDRNLHPTAIGPCWKSRKSSDFAIAGRGTLKREFGENRKNGTKTRVQRHLDRFRLENSLETRSCSR